MGRSEKVRGDAATIAGRIKALREKRGLSREALGKRLGLDRSAVAKWESGAHAPRERRRAPLAAALGVSVEELFGGSVGHGASNAALIDTMTKLPARLVALLNQTSGSLKALRIAAPYPTAAHVQKEFRRGVAQRLLAGTLEVQRIEIVYTLDRLKELVCNIFKYDGRPYWVKVHCPGLKDVVPAMGGYFFDDTHFVIGGYWSGVPPHDHPGLLLSGEPFGTYFRAYWNEIWRRGTILNHRGAHDLAGAKELAIKLGLAPGRWSGFVDEARNLDVGDGVAPLV